LSLRTRIISRPELDVAIVGKWFVFCAVGVRLLIPGFAVSRLVPLTRSP
jgi:hypothetical protein